MRSLGEVDHNVDVAQFAAPLPAGRDRAQEARLGAGDRRCSRNIAAQPGDHPVAAPRQRRTQGAADKARRPGHQNARHPVFSLSSCCRLAQKPIASKSADR